MIIAFEGIDACGKETQVRMLKRHVVGKLGQKFFTCDFPDYTTITGKKITELLRKPDEERDGLVLQALMTANRYEMQHWLRQAVISYDVVVLDRYWLSGLVYGMTDDLPLEWLLSVHKRLIQPDQWVVLDIPVGESFRRRPKREDEYEMNEHRLTTARRLYRETQDYVPDVAVIDANRTPEEVHEQIVALCGL